jgi:hypothetical protein
MRKTFLVTLGFVAMVLISFAFTSDKPRYQNLKVLPKNTTKEQLDSVMKHFTVALGVKCNYCHVRLNDEQKNWDFASDNNDNKKTARNMMRMTEKVNKKYFDIKNSDELDARLEVSCYTCHHGNAHPQKRPQAGAQPSGQQGQQGQRPPADTTRRQQ